MSSLRFLVAYFVAWIPAALLYSVMIYSASEARARAVPDALIGGIQSMTAAALLGLGVWWATTRLAERARPFATMAGAHLAMAAGYTALWNGFVLASIWKFAPTQVFESYVRFGLGWNLLTGLFIYGMVSGIAHALTVTRRLRREREATARAEALRTRAELSALRAQMNPHVLFNTLHSISALVRTDPKAVEDALERLAGLLRRLLDTNRLGADQVSLGEEWDIVRDQLQLEQLRFGDRLRVVEEIESEALDYMIPVFTLQPMVENAVKHGVAARTQPCTVRISARCHPERSEGSAVDMLELEVSDDGPGADRKTALNAQGLGLRALRQRLLAQFGDRGGVHVETEPGKGFLIRVTLPAVVATPQAASSKPQAVVS